MLSSYKPRNYKAQIVYELGTRIVQGSYQEGEQLPVEENLAKEFGVSRPIVREATKILASMGLLTAKPRVGTLVTSRKCWNLMDDDVLTWIINSKNNEQFLDMMFEVRSAIEPKAAALAAEKASDEDIINIYEAWRDMAEVNSLEESFEPDLRFHVSIFQASQNEFIQFIGRTLCKALMHSFELTTWDKKLYQDAVVGHKAVYDAIAARDPVQAQQAVLSLLALSRNNFDLREDAPAV